MRSLTGCSRNLSDTLSVTQVNRYIAGLMKRDVLLKNLTVEAEVSACTYHGSGHVYFTLKDPGGTLGCVMFSSDRARMSFRLTTGMKVVVKGTVGVYERDGKYQLYAKSVVQAGSGKLYEQFLQLKERLEEEGLFSDLYKQPLPPYALRIGIITAPKGAAVRDIIQIAKRRNPYVRLVLFPAIVQGEDAAPSIVKGLRALEQANVDVIICGRGGGSTEDLWAFNEESVARAIFHCRVPVISAVGHETDFTIADFVADLRAPTPSAAAELAVFEWRAYSEKTQALRDELCGIMEGKLGEAKDRLKVQRKALAYLSPQAKLRGLRVQNDALREKMTAAMKQLLQHNRTMLQPKKTRLPDAMQNRLDRTRHQNRLRAERLNGVSPLLRLRAGYGYLTDGEDRRVKSVTRTAPGDTVHIYLTDGVIDTQVRGVTKKDWTKETAS